MFRHAKRAHVLCLCQAIRAEYGTSSRLEVIDNRVSTFSMHILIWQGPLAGLSVEVYYTGYGTAVRQPDVRNALKALRLSLPDSCKVSHCEWSWTLDSMFTRTPRLFEHSSFGVQTADVGVSRCMQEAALPRRSLAIGLLSAAAVCVSSKGN